MAQEYAKVHEYFFQPLELPPPVLYHHQYEITQQANPSAAPTYGELTASDGGGAPAEAPPETLLAAHPPPEPPAMPMPPAAHPHVEHHDPRKKPQHFPSDRYDMSAASVVNVSRKRKSSSYGTASAYDDDGGDDTRSTSTAPDKKQNHSEIEKRRRDKMNTYITELSSMIPMCGAMARKLDKLTVLRMAVQHLRSVRGTLSACPLTARQRPSFLSEREINALILQAARDCFLLVVSCDRGRLLYVSASVKKMLHYEQSELLGQSLFDILHPKDVAKVKEQLSSSDLNPRERLIDIKTMLPVKADVVAGASRFCPGARRSFFCRIKCKQPLDAAAAQASVSVKEENEISAKMRKKQQYEKKYCIVQCTGYLKSWAPAEVGDGGVSAPEGGEEGDACNLSCLVAVGRALPDLVPSPGGLMQPPGRTQQYVSRHATDGKFLFVDQRVTLALGFLPQELLGTSLYEYVSGPELSVVARTHKQALLRRESLHTPPYYVRRKDNSLARLQTHFKPFKNPWTKDVECLVANNTIISDVETPQELDASQAPFDMYKQPGGHPVLDMNMNMNIGIPPRLPQRSAMYLLPGIYDPYGVVDPSRGGATLAAISEVDAEMQRLIDSQVESHKIGSAIAEEVLRSSSSEFSPDLPADLLQDVVFNQQASIADVLCSDASSYGQVRNNVPLSVAAGASSPPASQETVPPAGSPPPASPPLLHLGLDGNSEAAMAVIMTLLEADAGLGGPVNFSGLPWPLP